jgi:hypothetical protein
MFKKVLVGASASLALAFGVIGATAGSAAANDWKLCDGQWLKAGPPNYVGCLSGPNRVSTLYYGLFNDAISSVQTNGTAMETWNDTYFRGTYGYFAPWGTWNVLYSPYNNSISSFSYPGA